ncbi:hypothetical protein [Haloferula sargassicola]|uniref:hypothetical protein n=1 Tax=Haloferula sargassicola TaxID=490096 RepID=UPI003365371D
MDLKKKDHIFGLSMGEWIARIPNDLDNDGVGLWEIIRDGRESFSLEGDDLKEFVFLAIVSIMKEGGVPAIPSLSNKNIWGAARGYQGGESTVARKVIDQWTESGVDPDTEGIWFARIDEADSSG